MSTFEIFQATTSPVMQATVVDADGDAVDLTGCTVKLYVGKEGDNGARIVNGGSVTVTDGTAGALEYTFSASETASAGEYDAQFEITYAGGEVARTNTFTVKIKDIV